MATSRYRLEFKELGHEQAELHSEIYDTIKKEMGAEADQVAVVASADAVWKLLISKSEKIRKTK